MTGSDLARILARPIAHRGLHDRSRGIVENSITAAAAAIAAGFSIECDIQRASDGEAMVFHDFTLDRLTTGSGPVCARSSTELAGIRLTDSKDSIPTLPALLAYAAGRAPLVIEIKSGFDGDMRLAERAVALVAAYDGPVALKSFDWPLVAHCRSLGATCPLGLVGPPDADHPDYGTDDPMRGVEPDEGYDFLSWSVADLAALRLRRPATPLMSWTVRSRADQALAEQSGAQIVFERFRPDF